MDLKTMIIEHSKSIGIDIIGFTDVEPFEELRKILTERSDSGYLSGFEEKNIDLRVDPKKTMEEAQSIIVVGVSYYISEDKLNCEGKLNNESKLKNESEKEFYGELARTAWGKDYHLVLREKLDFLAKFISDEIHDFKYKAFVDTGPLVDRYLANRAGIGWYGYNSAIINKDFGSWIFIGYMLTNLSLEKDESLDGTTCIDCNLCIENCPTSAIEGPYQFNANKCLSNILQQKREVSDNVKPILNKRIYGCDICQNVCPHNIDIKEMTGQDFIPNELSNRVDLLELLKLSNKEYNYLFKENASGWRGKKVLQRNAIIVLGNYKDKEAIPYLIPLLKDARPDIRKTVIWAMYNIDQEIAIEQLRDMVNTEKDSDVLETIYEYLKK